MGLNRKAILRTLSALLILLGLAMVPSAAISAYLGERQTLTAFVTILIPLVALGAVGILRIRPSSAKLKIREGFLIVSLTWLMASVIGALPYLMTGVMTTFPDAFFESAAGFTTTGATIIGNVEALSKGLLFWRSFSQWLGGMGILIFAISLMPALGISGLQIAKAEAPGPTLSKMAPRMSDSAKILYVIYIVFTVAAILLFMTGGMSAFDATIASFASVASGGLSNYNDGLAHFGSFYIEVIAAVFTLLVCINFTLYYNILRGRLKNFFADRELRTFFGVLVIAAILLAANLWLTNTFDTFRESMRHGAFQAASFITTTGHFSADYNLWPAFSKMILFLLMLMGACSSSTGCGIKVIRVMVLFKIIRKGFYKKLHPRAMSPIKINNQILPEDTVGGISAYFYLYIFIFIFSCLILSFENLDILTTISSVTATLNNVGVGFGLVGPVGNFSIYSDFSKVFMGLLMIVGRLELFTVILLFFPAFWNPDR